MGLFAYLQQTQRFLREARQDFLNVEDLISYVNRARREVSLRTQCIRVLTPISGAITSWSLSAGGSLYSDTPTLTVSAPDFPSGQLPYPNGDQATASCIVQAGTITSIFSSYGGSGYYQPTLTIEDDTGSGATAADPTLTFINQLTTGQEVYSYSSIDLSMNPGCEAVYFVRSLAVLFSNYRYPLAIYPFSIYQAKIRQYPYQYQYVPAFASNYGQGTSGSFYMYPLPSQDYQYEADCQVIPSDLIDDNSYEAIPQPWTDAVPYFAAHLAYLELQNFQLAEYYLGLYDKMALRYSEYARPGRIINPLGRV